MPCSSTISVKCTRRADDFERLLLREAEIVSGHRADGARLEQVARDRADRDAPLGAVGALENLVERGTAARAR